MARIGRLIAGAAVLVLVGCGSAPVHPPRPGLSYLPPWERIQTPKACSDRPCRVQIDPSKDQWVEEYILADRGRVIHFELVDPFEFEGEGIFFKSIPGGADIRCPQEEGSRQKRVCHIGDRSPVGVGLPYGIKVKGKLPYDPYVWNR